MKHARTGNIILDFLGVIICSSSLLHLPSKLLMHLMKILSQWKDRYAIAETYYCSVNFHTQKPCHFKYNITNNAMWPMSWCTSWYNPKIIFHLTSCGTPRDKVGSSRNPLEVKRVVETGSTCDSHGHSHHRRATDHHYLNCHRWNNTCTRCTATGTCVPRWSCWV